MYVKSTFDYKNRKVNVLYFDYQTNFRKGKPMTVGIL